MLFFHILQFSSKFGWQYMVKMNYAWDFSQSEMQDYLEWIF